MCTLAFVSLLAVGAASAARSQRNELIVHPPNPRPRLGERLTFHGYWLGIPVGSGSIEVKELASYNGRPAYIVEARGDSNDVLSAFYPIHDTILAHLDADTLQPLRFEKHQQEGRYRADEIVTYDHLRGIATYQSLRNGSIKEIPITAGVHDIVSAFYWLRTQPIDPRQPVDLDLYTDEKVYRARIKPLGLTLLDALRGGAVPCLMAEPSASFRGILYQRGRMVVYVSASPSRIPLQIKIWTPWGLITGVIDEHSLATALAAEASGPVTIEADARGGPAGT